MVNACGGGTDWIGGDHALMVDTVAAMIEANRTSYRDEAKVVPIMMKATGKPKEAVEYAWDIETKHCVWSVNEGFSAKRTQWTIDNDVANGYIDQTKKPTVEQVVNMQIANEAVAAAGGREIIGGGNETRVRAGEGWHHEQQNAAPPATAVGRGVATSRTAASDDQQSR